MNRAPGVTLVLGANGFIGSHLVEALALRAEAVRAFDRFSGTLRFDAAIAPGIEVVRGDLMNVADVRGALEGCRRVLHFVSSSTPASSSHDPAFDIRTNVAPALEMLQLCVDAGVEHIYFASSGGTVYGESRGRPFREDDALCPVSPYGIGKATIEHYLGYFRAEHGLGSTALRISNPYGPRQSGRRLQGLIPIVLRQVRAGDVVRQLGDGGMVRDYLHVDDLTDMVMRVVATKPIHDAYNIGSGTGHSVAEVFEVIRAVTGVDFPIERLPQPATFVNSTLLDVTRFTNEYGAPAERPLTDGVAAMWETVQRGG